MKKVSLLNGKLARPTVKNAVTATMNSKSPETMESLKHRLSTTEPSTLSKTLDQALLTTSELSATLQSAEVAPGLNVSLSRFATPPMLLSAQLNFAPLRS
jgi:hypothetical protein